MDRTRLKLIVVVLIVLLIGIFFVFDLQRFLSLDYLKSSQQAFAAYYARHRLATVALYMAIHIPVTALSLPGATVTTLAGGALFGFVAISFASTIGATLAFLVSRFLLWNFVQNRFGHKLATR
jgi:uncharacterized membrane protein YdjX (TVP38/TMEM64 family)